MIIFAAEMEECSIAEIILKGLAIGFLAAAPTGPSGVLVIQRTLNKGYWKGFFTGVGVAVSDAFYIFVTMMCLSLVMGYLENPQISMTVKLVGCALLLAFGISTLRNNPLSKSKQDVVIRENFFQFPLTGFLVAIVNPLVIFIYMGLFAFFSFPIENFSLGCKAETWTAIVAGDLCWWLTLSFLINRLRNRFDLRGIWLINRILGTILICAAAGWFVLILIKG
ncbi:MAG: LysE family translocator [Bacteroidaceae bacterium]|nr:LysE family translocator [Bacteroidaceae bacterium]